MPRWPLILGTVGAAGITVGVMGFTSIHLVNSQRNKNAFVQHALQYCKSQPVFVKLLGEDFRVGLAKRSDDDKKYDETTAEVKIPIVGENDQAILYTYARRKDKQDNLRLYKLEVRFGKIEGKRLVLLDRSMEPQTSDEDWETAQFKLEAKQTATRPGS